LDCEDVMAVSFLVCLSLWSGWDNFGLWLEAGMAGGEAVGSIQSQS
jgi:hypothetical protein